MMIVVPGVLDGAALARCRALIGAADWIDGNAVPGRELPEASPAAVEMGNMILDALGRAPLFLAAALPARVFPPRVNACGAGETCAMQVDNAVRIRRADDFRVRSDLSATLFLNDPEDYDGGELTVEDTYGTHQVKLPAGDMILYPASSPHRVTAVTRGERLASVFWIQSMIRDDAARTTLFDLDSAIQTVAAERGHADEAIVRLTGVYHNLLRRWAEV